MQQIIREAASGDGFPPGTEHIRFISDCDGAADWFYHTPGNPQRRTVVFLHGALSQGDQIYTRADVRAFWLERVLAGSHPLLALNVRGTSYMNPATAADTHALLGWARRELGLNQITLLGGSGGAISALIYGLLYPDDVQGIITLGACDLARWYAFLARGGAPILDTLAETVRAAYGGTPDEAPALYQAHSVLAHADRITVPTVLTHGEADTLIPVEEARAVAAALAGNAEFRYIEVPGGDHDSAVWVDVDLETLEVREG
ncbi:MAG: alpha/beta hydrolase [Chloroflexi bacterium]|nr:alpha/beta hydrolase [Chloroflexota bacterium]